MPGTNTQEGFKDIPRSHSPAAGVCTSQEQLLLAITRVQAQLRPHSPPGKLSAVMLCLCSEPPAVAAARRTAELLFAGAVLAPGELPAD